MTKPLMILLHYSYNQLCYYSYFGVNHSTIEHVAFFVLVGVDLVGPVRRGDDVSDDVFVEISFAVEIAASRLLDSIHAKALCNISHSLAIHCFVEIESIVAL
jgi:hypothetical protein